MIRILIVDSCEVVRAGIGEALRFRPGCKVVAESDDGRRAVSDVVTFKPDIAIVELALPGRDGIEVTARIRRRRPKTSVLVFTVMEHEVLISDAHAAGARGFVLKSEPRHQLLEAVGSLGSGSSFLSPRVVEVLSRSSALRLPYRNQLTTREQSVLRLIADGHTNRRIGASLDITVKTVETHRASVMRKLNLPSLAALVRYAVRNNIVES
jgi:DNA-binding NarL/FixJ family response regulator